MNKLNCGCGLIIEVTPIGILNAIYEKNQENAEILKNMLCIRIQNNNNEQYLLLENYLKAELIVTSSNLTIYLANRGDPQSLTTIVGEIHIDEQGKIEVNAIQIIGVPELRSACYGILSQQTEFFATPLINENNNGPITDLHTHFSGILTADILIQGLQKKAELNANKPNSPNPIPYPKIYLEKIGIPVAEFPDVIDRNGQVKEGMIDLTYLLDREEDLKKFKQLLHIPANRQIIFSEMEEYYIYRGIFIQDLELFEFFLEKMAEEYKQQGIKYIEISFAKVAKPSYLKIIHKVLPEIEKNTGVKIRFLAMLARTASKEMRQLQIQKYEHISLNSPYVVGIDLLSAEVNSSYDFYPELSYLAQKYPGRIIRVHAGETSYHAENVKAIARLAKKYPKVPFRIGHGTYGVTKETIIALQACSNITIEVNMASNVALNMHACDETHPIDIYINANIPVVLGSDGHGLYQSKGTDLIKLLTYRYGAEEVANFIQDLHQRERKHINYIELMHKFDTRSVLRKLMVALRREASATSDLDFISSLMMLEALNLDRQLMFSEFNAAPDLQVINHLQSVMDTYDYLIKNKRILDYLIENVILGPQVLERSRAIAVEKTRLSEEAKTLSRNEQKCLAKRIEDRFNFSPMRDLVVNNAASKSSSVNTVLPVADTFSNKIPIMITGIIPYPQEPDDSYVNKITEVIAIIKTLLETLDCNNVYFATTGMDIGVQKLVHKLIADYNKTNKQNKEFRLVAYVQHNVKPEQLSCYLTDIVVIEDVGSIYNLYKYLTRLTITNGLRTICFGGSMWNNDVAHAISEILRVNWNINNHIKKRQLTLVPSKSRINQLPMFEAKTSLEVFAHSFDDLLTPAHELLYELYLQETKKNTRAEEIISMYGRVLPSTAWEIANLVLLSLDSDEFTEIIFDKEQRESALALLTECFDSLHSKVCDINEYEQIIHTHIDNTPLLTSQIKYLLIKATLEIWQEVTAKMERLACTETLNTRKLVNSSSSMLQGLSNSCFFKSEEEHSLNKVSRNPGSDINLFYRNAFLNSGNNIYNIPLGDKVAFKLSRGDALKENYTETERIAIKIVLEEQYRKREAKKAEELRYRTILLMIDKNTTKGFTKQYNKLCRELLSYLNCVTISNGQNSIEIIQRHIEVADIKLEEHIKTFLFSSLDNPEKIILDHDGRFNQASVNFILDKLVEHCWGEYTLDKIRAFLKNLNDSSTRSDPELLEYFGQLISTYTSNYIENKHSLIKNNTFIVGRLFSSGISFDNIYHFLTNKSFNYKSTTTGTVFTHGFYHNGIKVLDVYWGDSRFYPEQLINGIQIYKKHRIPEDEPWKSRDELSETDFEYVLDKRNNFIKRFSYRFIRPTERMLLATSNPNNISPTDTLHSFDEIEGNSSKNKYFVPHRQNLPQSFQEALSEELGEFSLNRIGTYRFVTTSQSAHKYDLRANNETLFLRHPSCFEDIAQAKGKAWQGGGLIKIDITYVDKDDVRCQYKAASRVNMDRVKRHIHGVVKKKLVKEFEIPTDAQWSAVLDLELNKAKISSLRNRETHFSTIPMRSIVGWKPYPQYPIWLKTEDVTLPIILTNNSYLVSYQVPDVLSNSLDFLNFEENKTITTTRDIITEIEDINYDTRYLYCINMLKTRLESHHNVPSMGFINVILQSIAINIHYAKKQINKQSLERVNHLVDIIFRRIVHEIPNYDPLVTLERLMEDFHPVIDKIIADWVNPLPSSRIYSDAISMAFYMSPKKTVGIYNNIMASESDVRQQPIRVCKM